MPSPHVKSYFVNPPFPFPTQRWNFLQSPGVGKKPSDVQVLPAPGDDAPPCEVEVSGVDVVEIDDSGVTGVVPT